MGIVVTCVLAAAMGVLAWWLMRDDDQKESV